MLSRPLVLDEIDSEIRNLHVCSWEETSMVKVDCTFHFFSILKVEIWICCECSFLLIGIFDYISAISNGFTIHSIRISLNDFLREFSSKRITEIGLASDVMVDMRTGLLHLWQDLDSRRTTADNGNRLASIIPEISNFLGAITKNHPI